VGEQKKIGKRVGNKKSALRDIMVLRGRRKERSRRAAVDAAPLLPASHNNRLKRAFSRSPSAAKRREAAK
jgi:hypothetical protein